MNKIIVLGVAALLSCATAMAQPDPNRGGRGGYDQAQMQQRIMDGIKQRLEITDDNEWKAIQPMVEKVMAAQRQAMGDRMRGFMGRRSSDSSRGGESDRGSRFSSMFGTPNPDAEVLQRAIDSKASKSELKAAVEKYVASRKAHQAELENAQAELRKVLTFRQEAIATLAGLL